MSILLLTRDFTPEETADWLDILKRVFTNDAVVSWQEAFNPDEIEYILVWGHERGEFNRFGRLKAIFSLGAGVDELLRDPDLRADVPVVRLIDPNLAETMTEYVHMRVLHYHRRLHEYQRLQDAGEWRQLSYMAPKERTIGVLGLGELGSAVCKHLSANGFTVCGWSRNSKRIPGVATYHGSDALPEIAKHAEILICLLPLTAQTQGVLSQTLFTHMPSGACLINVGRGGHLVERDLVRALDGNHLAHATLDVFPNEPLARESELWRHPKITVTPHCSALTAPKSAARIIAENIARHQSGSVPAGLVDRSRGY